MRVLVRVVVILLTIAVLPPIDRSHAKAYDVCVHERLEVTQIYGNVVAAADGSKLRGAEIDLVDRDSQVEVAHVEVGRDGSFALESVPSGGYWLYASFPGMKTLSVAVDFDPNMPKCSSSTAGINFHLGSEFGKPCGGGYISRTLKNGAEGRDGA